jgi:hypothetical protein
LEYVSKDAFAAFVALAKDKLRRLRAVIKGGGQADGAV